MDFEKYRLICLEQGWFSAAWYLDRLIESSHDLPRDGQSLFEHFTIRGFRLRLDPAPSFSVSSYLALNPDVARADIDPLYHFLAQGRGEKRSWRPVLADDGAIKPIAFYLPQYHPIPENDLAWGKGFTEWSNVTRATPNYQGHEQPRLPSELGFYDLRVPEVLEEQARLAQQYGIHGFCFYYYWFDGRRLLERPLEQYVANPRPTLPFCVCWANENWSKRWDGMDAEIIVGQQHTPLSDYRIIYDLLDLFADRRYIRVQGKPLLLLYRTDLLATPRQTLDEWREVARRAGHGGLYIAGVRFHTTDAQQWGLDALVEFPPHHFPAPDLEPGARARLRPVEGFTGSLRDYRAGVDQRVLSGPPACDAPLFPGVMPSWDNTARRGLNGVTYYGDSPELFSYWLNSAFNDARRLPAGTPRLTFINAWNEWAEGTCLEPGKAYGRVYLESVQKALVLAAKPDNGLSALQEQLRTLLGADKPVCLLLSHDAQYGGAQILLLRLLASLVQRKSMACAVLLCGDGPLREKFEALAPTLSLSQFAPLGWNQEQVLGFIAERCAALGDVSVLANTVACGNAVEPFHRAGIRVLSYVHELPTSIEMYGCAPRMQTIGRLAARTVVVSEFVRDALALAYQIPPDDLEVIRTGLKAQSPQKLERGPLMQRFGLPPARYLIVGVGAVHPRKGVDLFVQTAYALLNSRNRDDYAFVWLGGDQSETGTRRWAQHDARTLGIDDRLRFAGQVDDVLSVVASADCLLLTSREDPFPLVILEAIECGTPVICFEGAGGAPEIVRQGAGRTVAYLDTVGAARAIGELLDSPEEIAAVRERDGSLRELFHWDNYVTAFEQRLMSLAASGRQRRLQRKAPARQKVAHDLCVVIPSYNHERYIEEALDSVLSQSVRPAEIRIIDDGSTDRSPALFKALNLQDYGVIVSCRENRGAHETINQGILETRCPLVSILNSDDRFHPLRFEDCLPLMRGEDAADFLFTRVRFFDDHGNCGGRNDWYEGAVAAYETEGMPMWLALLSRNFFMTTSNLIANRAALLALGGFRAYRYSHDVDFLARACLSGKRVQFHPATLCDYRFHASNTIRENSERLAIEDAFLVADALLTHRPQLAPAEMALLQSAVREKKIGGPLTAFLAELAERPFAFDYRSVYQHEGFLRALRSAPATVDEHWLGGHLSQLLGARVEPAVELPVELVAEVAMEVQAEVPVEVRAQASPAKAPSPSA